MYDYNFPRWPHEGCSGTVTPAEGIELNSARKVLVRDELKCWEKRFRRRKYGVLHEAC